MYQMVEEHFSVGKKACPVEKGMPLVKEFPVLVPSFFRCSVQFPMQLADSKVSGPEEKSS
jgi:hypothetical protein